MENWSIIPISYSPRYSFFGVSFSFPLLNVRVVILGKELVNCAAIIRIYSHHVYVLNTYRSLITRSTASISNLIGSADFYFANST